MSKLTIYTPRRRGSPRFRFSWADAADALAHAAVMCLSVIPVAFQTAEQKVLPTVFAGGITAAVAFVVKAGQRFFGDSRR